MNTLYLKIGGAKLEIFYYYSKMLRFIRSGKVKMRINWLNFVVICLFFDLD